MSKFTEAVENGLKGLKFVSTGNCVGPCDTCNDNHGHDGTMLKDGEEQPPEEGSFSWRSCECCGSSLGGDRFAAHAFLEEDNKQKVEGLIHLDVCADCVLYIANGDEPETWE